MEEYDEFEYDGEAKLLTEDEIINEFLGENPRARELRLMRSALEQRREALQRDRERARDDKERTTLNGKIADLEKQITVLRNEEEITGFVETSVRVSLHHPMAAE
jgi:hypothetical protein